MGLLPSMAAGVQPGEVASLHKALDRISKESAEWRDEVARERAQLEQLKATTANRDKERAVLRADLRKSAETLKEAQQHILALEAKNADLIASGKTQDRQLAESLSFAGLDV